MKNWMPIDSYVYHYRVSDDGRVERYFSRKGWAEIKQHKNNRGYMKVAIAVSENPVKYKGIYVHRLVATAFIDNPSNKPEVDHINRVKTDNRVSNLRWVTKKENMANVPEQRFHIIDGTRVPYCTNNIQIKCVETGEVYNSLSEAANKHYTKNTSHLRQVLNNPDRMAFGLHWVSA